MNYNLNRRSSKNTYKGETYEKKTGKKLHQMNPSYYDLKALLEVQECLNKVR